jgi:hypothetical protein
VLLHLRALSQYPAQEFRGKSSDMMTNPPTGSAITATLLTSRSETTSGRYLSPNRHHPFRAYATHSTPHSHSCSWHVSHAHRPHDISGPLTLTHSPTLHKRRQPPALKPGTTCISSTFVHGITAPPYQDSRNRRPCFCHNISPPISTQMHPFIPFSRHRTVSSEIYIQHDLYHLVRTTKRQK